MSSYSDSASKVLKILSKGGFKHSDEPLSVEVETIGKLLTYKDRRFSIPHHQRSFVWTVDHVDRLIEDVEDAVLAKDSDYFLGTTLLVSGHEGEFQIVDGQQRMTALSLWLAAIANGLVGWVGISDEEKLQVGGHIRTAFFRGEIYVPSAKDPRIHLAQQDQGLFSRLLTEPVDDELRAIVRKTGSDPQKRLLGASDRFQQRVDSYVEQLHGAGQPVFQPLMQLALFLLNHLSVVSIGLKDHSEVYAVFESLNAKGMDLTPAELLKNFLFEQASKKGKLESAVDAWADSMSNATLEESDHTTFIKHVWNSRSNRATVARLYTDMARTLREPDQALDYIFELPRDGVTYSRILGSEQVSLDGPHGPRIKQALRHLLILNAEQMRPLVFALVRHWGEEDEDMRKDLAIALEILCACHVRLFVAGTAGSGSAESSYCALAVQVTGNELKSSRDLVKAITAEEFVPKDARFRDEFALFRPSSEKVARCLLTMMANYELPRESPLVDDPNVITLEHVYPKKPDKAGDWPQFKKEIRTDMLKAMGNLTLLLREDNVKARNRPYAYKREEIYSDSGVSMTRKLASDYPDPWTPKSIRSRQEDMANHAVQVWTVSPD